MIRDPCYSIPMTTTSEEHTIHRLFEFTLTLKAFYSIIEILGSVLVFLINRTYLVNTILSFTQDELSEDPKDWIAHYLITTANTFSISSQQFIAFYLLSHGVVKLFLIVGLFKKKLWAYPTSVVIFGMFIIYQLYRYSFMHSVWLLLLTLFDIIIILLTIHEYRYMKKYKLFKSLKRL